MLVYRRSEEKGRNQARTTRSIRYHKSLFYSRRLRSDKQSHYSICCRTYQIAYQLQVDSKKVISYALECIIRNDQDLSQKMKDVVFDYKAWYKYVTTKVHSDVPEIIITQIIM